MHLAPPVWQRGGRLQIASLPDNNRWTDQIVGRLSSFSLVLRSPKTHDVVPNEHE
jgi:hypothetical protein